MPQKHIIGLVVGVVGIGLLFASVYQQFQAPVVIDDGRMMQKSTVTESQQKKAPVPETIDDVILSIQEESSMDLSALDEEENGEIADIEADSNSVTHFETSYDENSL